MTQVDVCLNVWASKEYHEAGGGSGYPLLEEILLEPAFPEPVTRPATDSEYLYDATPGKYERSPKWSDAVLSRWEMVENCLVDAPEWVRAYLLFKYPTTGRYGPLRGQETASGWEGLDPDDPAGSFVDVRGQEYFWVHEDESSKRAVALVHQAENKVHRRLKGLLGKTA